MKRRFVSRRVAGMLCWMMVLSVVTPPAWAQAPVTQVVGRHVALVVKVRGKVEVRPVGTNKWQKVTLDQRLKTGDRLRTGADGSCRIKFGDVGEVVIKPGSEGIIGNLRQIRTTASAFLFLKKKIIRDDVEIDMKNGDMRAHFRRKEGRVGNYNVYTPVAVAGVRGTIFGLDLEGAKPWYEQLEEESDDFSALPGEPGVAKGGGNGGPNELNITVAEGTVLAQGGNWSREINGGQFLNIRKGKIPGNPTNADPGTLNDLNSEFADNIPPAFSGAGSIERSADGTSAKISWSPATDDKTDQDKIVYGIFVATRSGGQDFSQPTHTTDPGATTFELTGLDPAQDIFVVVRARDQQNNWDANQKEVSTSSLDLSPPDFSGVETVERQPDGTVVVSWNAADDDRTSSDAILYDVYVATQSGGQDFTKPTATSDPGATQIELTGLSENEDYYIVVRARDEAGNADDNTKEATTLRLDKEPPVFGGVVNVSEIALGTLQIEWNSASDNRTDPAEIVYDIYLATEPGAEDFTTPTATSYAGATSHILSGIPEALDYYVVVRARDAEGNRDENLNEFHFRSLTYLENILTDRINELFTAYENENSTYFMKIVNASFAGVNSAGNALTYSTLLDSIEADFQKLDSADFDVIVTAVRDGGDNSATTDITWNGRIRFTSTGEESLFTSKTTILAWDLSSLPATLISWEGASPFGVADPLQNEFPTGTNAPYSPPTVQSQIPANGILTSDLIVPAGQTLTLDATTTLDFQGPYSLIVEGTVDINGTTITGSGWNGIVFQAGGGGTIQNASIQNATIGVTVTSGSPSILNNTFSNNGQVMLVTGGSPSISGNTINAASPGLVVTAGSPTIDGNTFTGSGSTDPLLSVTGSASPTVTNNSFNGNGGVYFNTAGSATFSGNSITGSVSDGLVLEGTGTIDISNLTISSPANAALSLTSSFSGTANLSGTNSLSATAGAVIAVAGGTFSATGTNNLSAGGPEGIAVSGAASSVSLDGVIITAGASTNGIVIASNTNTTISNSSISSCGTGLDVAAAANVNASALNINGCNQGVLISNGTVNLSSISIANSAAEGIALTGGALTVTNASSTGNSVGLRQSGGTLALDGTTANSFSNNTMAGLDLSGGSVTFTGSNAVDNNAGNGLILSGLGATTIDGISASGNQSAGIQVQGGGPYTFTNVTVSSNSGGGLVTSAGIASDITISNSTFSNNSGMPGIDVNTSGNLTLTTVNSTGNGDGLRVFSTGTLSVVGGSFSSSSTGDGIRIDGGGNASLSGVTFSNNMGAGLNLVNHSSVSVDNCTFSGNGHGLDLSSPSGAVTVTNSTVSGSSTFGINISSGAGVTLSFNGNNTISDLVDCAGGSLSTSGASNNFTQMMIRGSASATLDNSVTISGANTSCLSIDGNANVTISGSTISNCAAGNGIDVLGAGATVNVSGAANITGAAGYGIYVSAASNVNLMGINITNNSSFGIGRPTGLPPGAVYADGVYLSGNNGDPGVDTASTDGTGSPNFTFTSTQYENMINPPNTVTNPATGPN